MRFDWYSATIHQPHDVVVGALESCAHDESEGRTELRNGKGLHRYSQATEILTASNLEAMRYAWCMWDPNEPNITHVQATSGIADTVANHIREYWPEHKVSRADICQDWRGGRPVYDLMRNNCMTVAKAHKVKSLEYSSPTEETDGRTLYLGSPSSAVRSRLYEKGLHPDAWRERIPTDVVRLEFQVRPSSKQKAALAQMPLNDCVAAGGWGRELAERAQLYPGEQWNPNGSWTRGTLEKTAQAMFAQYGRCLLAYLDRIPDPVEFRSFIENGAKNRR